MTETLTFDPDINNVTGQPGWTSRFSFYPDFMAALNGTFFSFKDGDLYEHDSDLVDRCEFYGVKTNPSIIFVFNEYPNTQPSKKEFKTLHIIGNGPWTAETTTELSSGLTEYTSFQEKEADWFAYLRRTDSTAISSEDAKLISTQGAGIVQSFTLNVITFTSTIDTSMFAVGDRVYRVVGNSFVYIGDITAYSSTTITVGSAASTPVAGNFIAIGKNKIAESFGLRGNHMIVKLTEETDEDVKLFSVSTDISKSFP